VPESASGTEIEVSLSQDREKGGMKKEKEEALLSKLSARVMKVRYIYI